VTAPAPDFAGTERFQLVRRIGAGGVGVVYEAFDKERNSVVALKTLRTFSPEAVLRFKQEFRALQDIGHRNLVRLGELIEEEGNWFFTMELVKGVHLLRWVRPESGDEMEPSVTRELAPGGPRGATVATPALPTARFEEARLRDALGQLARGLHALHGKRMVHRDLKSSNILVSPDGRVVVLDFGLVVAAAAARRAEDGLAGTVSHMAPEQAAGRPVGPEADWYAVGVVLYQALTGLPPFAGTQAEVLLQKQLRDPTPPRALVPSVPEDLDELCRQLLHREPSRRPAAAQVLQFLAFDEISSVMVEPPVAGDLLVGRQREREQLHEALLSARGGQATAVVVQGESGVGKSTLVRHFVAEVLAREPAAVALVGRCYERESVPYKAVDGVVDALARYLGDAPDARQLVTPESAVLGQVFPVLRAHVPERGDADEDPARLRTRMFAALRELLARLAERGPLVIAIDDLQWADADSLGLLTELMRRPDEPRLLLVATVRRTHDASSHGGLPPPWYGISGHLTPLVLDSLPLDDAVELARRLGATDAERTAKEAQGHPLFIDELVRRAREPGQPERLRLDDALWARIQRQDEAARHLLEIVALAGAPLVQETAAAAAALELDELARVEAALRGANLARTSGPRPSDLIECYHDRVREAIVARLSPERRRELYGKLAAALELTARGSPEELSVSWREAGDLDKAAWYAAEAAARAADVLAFDRAARLYRQALELKPLEGAGGRALQVALGEALANAGRGAEAAQAFLTAAASVKQRSGGDEAQALELQRRAAEQLLRSGHIDEGMERLRVVLAEIGVPIAKTPRRALMSLVVHRAQLRLRGLWFKARPEEEVPPEELARVDVTWSAAIGMAMVDTVRGADFQTRCLLLALRSGEPRRIVKAIALEAANNSAGGWPARKRTRMLLDLANELALHVASPYNTGLILGTSGIAAFLEGRWADARKLVDRAELTFRDRCVGAAWERDNVLLFHLWTLVYLGEIRELNLRMPRALREAESRGDRFAATSLRTGDLAYYWLCRGDPDGALEAADESMRRWTQQGFLHQHWDDLLARCEIDLYRGDGGAAFRRMEERWKSLSDSFLLLIQVSRTEAHFLRARSALAAFVASRDGRLLELAARDAKRLAREKTAWARPMSLLIRALLDHLGGQPALDGLRAAEEGFAAADMQLHAHVVRRQRGRLTGGSDGALLVEDADAWLRWQEVRDPERLANMMAPGVQA
jgi:eukaryotic-like serine/threonine-protein kinase